MELHVGIGVDVDASLAIGQEEQIVLFVPGDLVDLEPELFFPLDLLRLHVDERDQVLLVAHRDRLSVRTPVDVDVLALGRDVGDALAGPRVPDPDRLVARGRGQQVWVERVPS